MTIDRTVLVTDAYADGSRLAARMAIYAFQRPRIDLVGGALAHLSDVTGVVLDVGWGTGAYTAALRSERPDLRVVPVDLSAGMRPEVVGEVDRLPFATGSVGAALAMHMLYYARDPHGALCELRRVLRAGGRFLASTNARDDKRELSELWTASLRDLGVTDPPSYPATAARFPLEAGAALVSEVFGACETDAHRSEVVVPEPGPVVAYVESMRDLARHLPAGVPWAAYRAAAERRIRAEIARTGAFRLTVHSGTIAARRT